MITLFYSPGACSLAPHIMLEEIGVPYETKRFAIAEGAHQSAEFIAINPQGRVPALQVDDRIVTENIAILTLLATRFPEAKLLPKAGTAEFGTCLQWMSWIASNLHIAFAQIWRQERFVAEAALFPAIATQGRISVERFFGVIEAHLAGQSEWFLGSQYTLVDINVAPFYRFGSRIGFNMPELYPYWSAWSARLLERPAVQRIMAKEGVAMTDVIPA